VRLTILIVKECDINTGSIRDLKASILY